MIGKDRTRIKLGNGSRKIIATRENIVPQHERHRLTRNKVIGNQKRLCDSFRFDLLAILNADTPVFSVTQQVLEARQTNGVRNKTELTNARRYQYGKRIIHHGLVIDRLQLLTGNACQRIQMRPSTAKIMAFTTLLS